MIFQLQFLDGIRRGDITLAFRRWVRPSVREGGTLKTAMGVVRFGTIRKVARAQITDDDARAAGYPSAALLLAELDQREDGELYRIEVGYAGEDPRIVLRQQAALTPEDWTTLRRKLARLDAASERGPWTAAVLRSIADQPAVRAATLAGRHGQQRDRFKLDVRKLKNLGLTESLEIGYRLSPRGQRVLQLLQGESDGAAPEAAAASCPDSDRRRP